MNGTRHGETASRIRSTDGKWTGVDKISIPMGFGGRESGASDIAKETVGPTGKPGLSSQLGDKGRPLGSYPSEAERARTAANPSPGPYLESEPNPSSPHRSTGLIVPSGRSHLPRAPAPFFPMLFAGLILLALALVAVVVFRNHEKLYDWPIWAVTTLAFSWLILAAYAFGLIARGMIA